MDFESYLEQLDENARHSLKFEEDYHRDPSDPLEYSYGIEPPFEHYHEEALMDLFDAAGRFTENHPDREKLEKKLDGYKNKVAAYERLYRKELGKPGKGNYGTFSKKYPPPYQKALAIYLEKSADIKTQLGVSGINRQQSRNEKENPTPNAQEKQYPVWLRDEQPVKDMNIEKEIEMDIEPER